MGMNINEEIVLHPDSKFVGKGYDELSLCLVPKPILPNTIRPNSVVIKKVCPREFIPPHIVAEAISTPHGLDLRWSGPITPSEMQYVEQYVHAKYPQYSHGLVEESDKDNLYSIYCRNGDGDDSRGRSLPSPDCSRPSPIGTRYPSPSPSLDRTQLEPSRLLDILTKKSTFPGSLISIPEIQARNRALQHCGLSDEDNLVIFTPTRKDAMMLIGESYPFLKYIYYMTVIDEDADCIREFAAYKDSKVVPAPVDWLDLRIKGSQLSQYFRRKCKYSSKGLFAYPAEVQGTRTSLHWVSEAHRNSWHVLLDATAIEVGRERLNLALHRPDFVLCTLENTHARPSNITSLMIRKKSFATSCTPTPQLQS